MISRMLFLAAILAVARPSSASELDAYNTGSLTANGQAVVLALGAGQSVCTFVLTGTFTATVTFKGKARGGSYNTLTVTDLSNGLTATTATAAGAFAVACGGLSSVEAVTTAYTSGTIAVTGVGSMGVPAPNLAPIVSTIASVGATGSAVPASANYCGYSDGTNLRGAVVIDGDSGAGTQYLLATSGRVTTSGGSVEQAHGTGVRSASTQRVTIATDDVCNAAQSGVWTVQPGNTANTTAWKVDGSAVTQPITGSVAHDAVDSGNPVSQGLNAQSAAPTAVAASDRVRQIGNLYGEARIAAPQCTGTMVKITTTAASATGTVTASQFGRLCVIGAPVYAIWGGTASLTTGFAQAEGACEYTWSSGTSLSAITAAGGGFVTWTPCSY